MKKGLFALLISVVGVLMLLSYSVSAQVAGQESAAPAAAGEPTAKNLPKGARQPLAAKSPATAPIALWNSGLSQIWGLAPTQSGANDVWVGSPSYLGGDGYDHRFLLNGTNTGDTINENLGGYWAADIAPDPSNNKLWQVNVGDSYQGDLCIYELDPVTKIKTGNKICPFSPSSYSSQRGVAYDRTTDTFFTGGWNDTYIYRFNRAGSILESYYTGLYISGLAYNPNTDHLFIVQNDEYAYAYDVSVLDWSSKAWITSWDIDGMGDYEQAGADLDCAGNLWLANQYTQQVLAIATGESVGCTTGSGLDVTPKSFDVNLAPGGQVTQSLQLYNPGSSAVQFTIGAAPAGPQGMGKPLPAKPAKVAAPASTKEQTAKGLSRASTPLASKAAARPADTSWNSGLSQIWGLSPTQLGATDVWVGSPSYLGGDGYDHRFLPNGTNTGDVINENLGGYWAADIAPDPSNNKLWQVNVGDSYQGDLCIYELDPVTKIKTGNKICPFSPSSYYSQRGVAYDRTTDTFFTGGWNDMYVYRFNRAGSILESYYTGLYISGLAYNPSTDHLFIVQNDEYAYAYDVTVIDWSDKTWIDGWDISGMGDYEQAGADLDCAGNLWMANQATQNVLSVATGETGICTGGGGVGWLNIQPNSGTVNPGSTFPVGVGFYAGSPGVYHAIATVTPQGGTPINIPITLTVGGASLEVTPGFFDIFLAPGGQVTQSLTLANTGSSAVQFTIGAAPAAPQGVGTPLPAKPAKVAVPASTKERTAKGLSKAGQPLGSKAAARPADTSWPSGLAFIWGLAPTQNATPDIWVGNIAYGGGDDRDHRFTPGGSNTGDSIDAYFGGVFSADITHDTKNNKLWQLDVGYDNCAHELDPVTKTQTGATICPAFPYSERGLAYDRSTDTFFAGSWNDQYIYRFDRAGNILESVYTGMDVSGLAYNPSNGHLYVVTNSEYYYSYDVYVIDWLNLTVINQFDVSGLGDYEQAGADLDCAGNLWMANQTTQNVLSVATGETGICTGGGGVPWLKIQPNSGTVNPGSTFPVGVGFYAAGLEPGSVHHAIATVTPQGGTPINIPITLTVGGASLDVTPGFFDVFLAPGGQVTQSLTLANTGSSAVQFTIGAAPAGPQGVGTPLPAKPARVAAPASAKELTAKSLPKASQPLGSKAAARPADTSWPSGLTYIWGLAPTQSGPTDIWVGNLGVMGGDDLDHRFLPNGTNTGDTVDAYLSNSDFIFAADITHDTKNNKLWQVNVGNYDYCVYELDPVTKVQTGVSICPPFPYSERGLAYDRSTDTFFAGSWNDQYIYRFDRAGNILETVSTGMDVSGLAYNPSNGHLYVVTNSEYYSSYDVYVIDWLNLTVINQFDVSGLGDYEQAGADLDCAGNLWMANQTTQNVLSVATGETGICTGGGGVPWLNIQPNSGTVNPGSTFPVGVGFYAAGLEPGSVHHAIATVTPQGGTPINIPITLTVNAPANWGKIVGNVKGLGQCDAGPEVNLAGALVQVSNAGGPVASTVADSSGNYLVWVDPALGPYTVTASKDGYVAHSATGITVPPYGTVTVNHTLRLDAPCANANPQSFDVTLAPNGQITQNLQLGNTGGGALEFSISAAPAAPQGMGKPLPAKPAKVAAPASAKELTAKSLPKASQPLGSKAAARPADTSWPSGLAGIWGLAPTQLGATDIWVGNISALGGDDRDHRFTPGGSNTGDSIDAYFGGVFSADITHDTKNNKLWQLDVGYDNCAHELDPVTKTQTGAKICPPFPYSERGLAYDRSTDTFFAGSWNDDTVYRFDRAGNILESVYVGVGISGLAYNPSNGHLYIVVNDEYYYAYDVYVVDWFNMTWYNIFDVAGLGDYEQAGADLDCAGNLWMANQTTQEVLSVATGETGVCTGGGVGWLNIQPNSGIVNPGGSATIGFGFNAAGLDAGVYKAVATVSAPDMTPFNIPITLTVASGPPTANFSGTPVSGTVPFTVTFTNSSSNYTWAYWEFGDGATSTSAGTTVQHQYVSPGTFTVKLTVSNTVGMNTMVRSNYITGQASGTVDLVLVPAAKTVSLNEVFTAAIQVRAGSQLVDGVGAYIDFDKNVFQVVDAVGNPTDVIESAPGNPLTTELENFVDNGAGKINYSVGKLSGTKPSGTFDIGIVRLMAVGKATSGSAVPYVFDVGNNRKTDVTYAAASVLRTAVGGVYTVTGNTDLLLVPAAATIGFGQTFTVGIEVQSGSQEVDGVGAYLHYDPSVFQVVDAAGNPATEIEEAAGNPLNVILQNEVISQTGSINYAVGKLGTPKPSGTFLIGVIRFKAIVNEATTSSVYFEFDAQNNRNTDVTYNMASVLRNTYGGEYDIVNGILAGTVTLQAREVAPPAAPYAISLTVRLMNLDAGTDVTVTVQANQNAVFEIAGLTPGTYSVTVKNWHTLRNVKSVEIVGGVNNVDFGTLLEGDADNTNQINITDFSVLATTFGKSSGQPGFDPRADFNYSGQINIMDFSALAANFGKSGA